MFLIWASYLQGKVKYKENVSSVCYVCVCVELNEKRWKWKHSLLLSFQLTFPCENDKISAFTLHTRQNGTHWTGPFVNMLCMHACFCYYVWMLLSSMYKFISNKRQPKVSFSPMEQLSMINQFHCITSRMCLSSPFLNKIQ